MYKFAAAWEQETIVFGASQPGYSNQQVEDTDEVYEIPKYQASLLFS